MKKVLITGASGDLGSCLSFLYAKEGYHVIIHYNNNENKAKQIENKIKQNGGSCEIIKCDITDELQVINLANKLKNIDILINNATYYCDEDFYEKDINNVKKVLNVNLVGTYLVSREISKIMDKGVIINISSNNAFNTNYQESIDYDMSKAAIVSLTNNLADLLSPNIRVVTVSPGWIATEKNKCLNEEFKTSEENKILMKRFGSTEEIANVILFVSSDKASYINKTVITVDGGLK